jgi:hypothetical protein
MRPWSMTITAQTGRTDDPYGPCTLGRDRASPPHRPDPHRATRKSPSESRTGLSSGRCLSLRSAHPGPVCCVIASRPRTRSPRTAEPRESLLGKSRGTGGASPDQRHHDVASSDGPGFRMADAAAEEAIWRSRASAADSVHGAQVDRLRRPRRTLPHGAVVRSSAWPSPRATTNAADHSPGRNCDACRRASALAQAMAGANRVADHRGSAHVESFIWTSRGLFAADRRVGDRVGALRDERGDGLAPFGE